MTINGAPSSNGRADGLTALSAQLAQPETAAQLQDILSKLDVIQLSVTALDGVLRRGEELTENLAEGVGEVRGAIDPSAILALGRLVAMTPKLVDGLEKVSPALESEALEKLGDPALVDALASLSSHAHLLTFAAEAASGFLERGELIVENISEGVQEIRGITDGGSQAALDMLSQLGSLLPAVQALLSQVQPLVESGSFEHLANSKILAPEMVDTVARVGDALHATRVSHHANPTSLGVFGMLKALRDPDAKRGLGFLATFLKEFGRQMR